ncbi:MAG: hypothetical protein J2P30_26845, partial [Actinobacteria bacterium]|nr:hypothetical protein [Actinomycetota bacterium]
MTELPTIPETGGLLMWGQEGEYSAYDDRTVITALTATRTGVIRAATFNARDGLTIETDPGWLAAVPCGDDTNAVAGSRQVSVIAALPGDPAVSRQDVIWLDVFPDEGRWALGVLQEAETAGRPGLALGSITVPPGATAANQMVITA